MTIRYSLGEADGPIPLGLRSASMNQLSSLQYRRAETAGFAFMEKKGRHDLRSFHRSARLSPLDLPLADRLVSEPGSVVAHSPLEDQWLRFRLQWTWGFWLCMHGQPLFLNLYRMNVLEAMLIALNTLCQFDSTVATAGITLTTQELLRD